MSFSLMSNKASMAVARPTKGRQSSVRVMAADNVAEARAWIGAWKDKKNAAQNRTSWWPGSTLPAHLDGTLAGDFGFDPMSLGVDKSKLKWYQQAELMNGRTAMAAVAGILVPELLSSLGMGGPAAANKWFDHASFEYWAPNETLTMMAFFLSAWVEIRRYMDIQNPGSVNQDPVFPNQSLKGTQVGYPGFDPMGYSKGPEFETMKLKEIKNGRLAMLAFAGFAAQAYTTGTTPLEGLGKHLANPWATTVLSFDLARASPVCVAPGC